MRSTVFYSLFSLTLIGPLSLIPAAGASETAQRPTAPERIHRAAERFMKDYASGQQAKGREVSWELGSVDRRLSLSPCPKPLAVEFTGEPERSTRTTLLISCKGDQPWRIFLGAEVEIAVQGWVSAQPIGRGQQLTRDMLQQSMVVINRRRRSGFKDPDNMLGMEAKRSINAGSSITPAMLARPEAVKRGDRVVISVSSDAFSIETRGEAVKSGRVGEQISVINENSGRRVRGRITEPGHVTITR